jgi:hypothetical protein
MVSLKNLTSNFGLAVGFFSKNGSVGNCLDMKPQFVGSKIIGIPITFLIISNDEISSIFLNGFFIPYPYRCLQVCVNNITYYISGTNITCLLVPHDSAYT